MTTNEPIEDELRALVRTALDHIDGNWPQAEEWRARALEVLGERPAATREQGIDAPHRTCCPKCGSTALHYQEFVPTVRDIIDVRDATIWVDEQEEHCWETSFGGRLACTACAAEFPLPKGHSLEWTASDYVERYGRDALNEARAARVRPTTGE